jgi:hypothetical protein
MEYGSSPGSQKLATGSHPETLISNGAVLAVRILNIVTEFTLRLRQYILPKGS